MFSIEVQSKLLEFLHGPATRWFQEQALLIVALLILALLFLWGALLWGRGAGGRRVRFHQRIGVEGERKALYLLKRAGFHLVSEQTSQNYQIQVDGEPLVIRLRADFLVTKAGQLFVAEAKNGTSSAKITGRATRRQLLEYLYAFRVSGVLLVDVKAEAIHTVEFPIRRS